MINRYLDHAILVPQMTRQEAIKCILSGIKHKVKTVCVRPCDISLAVEMCRGTETEVSCVLGFPHGTACTKTKIAEAKLYCKKGVAEIDMVANYGWIRSGLWDEVRDEIQEVVNIAHHHWRQQELTPVLVKVILETSQLTPEEITRATEICIEAGADFVKTSTGFNGEGAKEEDVRNMLKTAAGRIKVKPSGGIRDKVRAQMFVDMGVDRLGVNGSSTPNICGETGNSNEKSGY
ncbi:MAG: deoxyribose-phosphate aldolase [Planctomycetaceae bacterium]|jgi:deoxyribose-phosphate aldolase|nr:deoxyribose-phosphate aldolase [Planctomycetaceae bacterium]